MRHSRKSDIDINSDSQKKRSAIKLANRIEINGVSQVILTGGGVGLLCTKTMKETISSRSGGLTTVIAG